MTLKKELQNKVITRILGILEAMETAQQPARTNAREILKPDDNKAHVSHVSRKNLELVLRSKR